MTDIRGTFPDMFRGLPTRWFVHVGAAKEFGDWLFRSSVIFRTQIVRRRTLRQKSNFGIAVMYLGVEHRPDPDYHIVPVDDLREHAVSKRCWCAPVYSDDGMAWVHTSVDQRELYEEGLRKPG